MKKIGILFLSLAALTPFVALAGGVPMFHNRAGGTGASLATLGLATTSTDNAIVRFDGATGGTQNSVVFIADTTGDITGPGGMTINGGAAANDDISIQGTSHATRTTSYVILQPTAGNVGIGSTAPESLLEIQGAEATDAIFTLDADDGDDAADTWSLQSLAASNSLGFFNDVNQRVTITSGGKVGIGDTTPDTGAQALELDVEGDVGAINYCDEAGNNCFTASGILTSVTPLLNNILAATGAQAGIANGDNAIVWNWATTTAAKDAFTFGETTASTASGESSILKATTLATSTATPLMVTNLGAAASFRVNDATDDADTTPFIVDAAGNVGIGTVSPTYKLEVFGSVGTQKIRSTTVTNAVYTLWNNEDSDNALFIGRESSGGGGIINGTTAYAGVMGTYGSTAPLQFSVNNSVKMTIVNSGNLGIGTVAPEALLEVQGTDDTDAVIGLDADNGDDNADTWFLKSLASGNSFSFVNHTTEVANLTSAGALQIDGALNPTDKSTTRTNLGFRANEYCYAISDFNTTAIVAATSLGIEYLPAAFTVTGVRAYTRTAPTGLMTIDINEGGTTILSTKLTIDANEKSSGTAAAAAVISDTAIAANAEITIDVDSTTGGKGGVVCLEGTF